MAETTTISWATASFNGWIGCTRISPACKNCYAAAYGNRFGVKWGPGQPRRRTSEGKWREPLSWNRKAEREGTRPRVFCASLADWLDHEVPAAWLADLLTLIDQTPHLDWLLLTKRPERFRERLAAAHKHETGDMECDTATSLRIEAWLDGKAWPNVWVGTTVESQEYADKRIPALLKIPAQVRFLSCEPLLGPVDLDAWIERRDFCDACGSDHEPQEEDRCPACKREGFMVSTWGHEQAEDYRNGERYAEGGPTEDDDGPALHWIIAGGESGTGARITAPDWARSLRDQAQAAGVAFHWKQWGEWAPRQRASVRKGVVTAEIPSPEGVDVVMARVGKVAAGRELDGVVWDEVPEAATS